MVDRPDLVELALELSDLRTRGLSEGFTDRALDIFAGDFDNRLRSLCRLGRQIEHRLIRL
jgi:hypothetical protein